jgi:iron(III) transport system substrate-binding protein
MSRRNGVMIVRELRVTAVAVTAMLTFACGGTSAPATSEVSPTAQDQQIFKAVQKVIPGVTIDLVAKACQEAALDYFQLAVTPSAGIIDDTFQKLVPCVKLNATQAAGGQLLQRFNAAKNTGNSPDILELSQEGAMVQFAKSGDFLKYVPTVAKNVDTPNPGYWYPDYGFLMGFAYNTKSIPDSTAKTLTSWQAIQQPGFSKAKIGFVSPAAGGTALLAFYHMVHVYGQDFVKQFFASHKVTVFSTSRPAADAVASGQLDIAFPMAHTTTVELWSKGAPVHQVLAAPVDESFTGLGIPKNAKHPNAAKLFVEFVLSSTGQTIFDVQNGAIPTNSAVKSTNKVVNESWWSVPTSRYKHDATAVDADARNLLDFFDQISH